MSRTHLTTLLALVLSTASAPALATVGGPATLEVLGFDPVDGKLFLLGYPGGGSGDLPRLSYYHLDASLGEQRPDGPTVVHSWYEGDPAEAERRFPERLEHLRARVSPLEAAPLAEIAMSLTLGELTACPIQQEQPTAEDVRRALAMAEAEGRTGIIQPEASGAASALVSVCREIEVTVRWGEHQATTQLTSWGPPEPIGAWTVPGHSQRLVVLRHLGITFETGYTADVPLLLTAPPL